jgi:hypothetical protein
MRIRFSDLWTWQGTIDRGTYALVGIIGFAIKHNLDRLLAIAFGRKWGLFNYWIPLSQAVRVSDLPRRDAHFLATMLALALPFIWIGVVLTLKRLRSAGLPSWLVIFFFAPVANLAFFLLLSVWPARSETTIVDSPFREQRRLKLDRWMPTSAFGSAMMAIFVTAAIGFALTLLATTALRDYGWGIFAALPFCLGCASVLIYSYREPRRFGSCILVCILAVAVLAAALLAFAAEGLICIFMAAPLGLALALLGGVLGYQIQLYARDRRDTRVTLSVLFLFIPGIFGMEQVVAPKPTVFSVRTAIEIDAPPEEVWQQVVAFAQIPEPRELMFRMGIAYPIRAEISGVGVGAVRHCVFSTGAFVEPIEIWDPPHLLKFSVTSNPAPMQEWTPYSKVEPPHLHGFLVSNGGQFLLTPLPAGRTRLEGTTWYRHSMWPEIYWRTWSDFIIHRIHLRVLRHIELQATKRD